LTPLERAQARSESRDAVMANGGIAVNVSQEDADRARAQAPAVAKAMTTGSAKMPDRQSQSVDPKAVPVTGQRELIGPEIPAGNQAMPSKDTVGPKKPEPQQDMSQDYLQQMVALQQEQIKLLKKQVKVTGEIDV